VAHPEFYGSYSMKNVAPAIAQDVTYADLDIADGGAASAVFYRFATDPTLSAAGRLTFRESLLTYCARDTLALARIHQWLMEELTGLHVVGRSGIGPRHRHPSRA